MFSKILLEIWHGFRSAFSRRRVTNTLLGVLLFISVHACSGILAGRILRGAV